MTDVVEQCPMVVEKDGNGTMPLASAVAMPLASAVAMRSDGALTPDVMALESPDAMAMESPDAKLADGEIASGVAAPGYEKKRCKVCDSCLAKRRCMSATIVKKVIKPKKVRALASSATPAEVAADVEEEAWMG